MRWNTIETIETNNISVGDGGDAFPIVHCTMPSKGFSLQEVTTFPIDTTRPCGRTDYIILFSRVAER